MHNTEFRITTNRATGKRRYYTNGKRVSKALYEYREIFVTVAGGYFDTIYSTSTKTHTRDFKHGRIAPKKERLS